MFVIRGGSVSRHHWSLAAPHFTSNVDCTSARCKTEVFGETVLLPCQCYFHVNGSSGIVQKIEFEIRPDLGCTISLKGIVQRKGPVALPSSGRKITFWFSRVCASPEPLITAGKYGVGVKVLNFHSSGGVDWGSNPVGPNFFSREKKSRHFSAFSFSPQRVARLSPVCHQPHI